MEIKKVKRLKLKKPFVIVLYIIFLIALGVSIYSGYKIVVWMIDNNKTKEVTENILEEATITEIIDNVNTEYVNQDTELEESNPYWDFIKINLMDVNFSKLKETNKDTIAWIKVDNTNINYPVVQSNDNSYYLTHSFDKSYNSAGWLFADYRNNILRDKNTIIYGHARRDNSMLGSLRTVLTNEWLNGNNSVIKFSTNNENTLWQIFSVYTIQTETYYLTTDFSNDDEYNSWLMTMKGRSIKDFNTSVDTNDQILTLSTCKGDTDRIVVHAKLIKKESK